MPWYESQLAGTIFGTVLGFLLAYVPSTIERRRIRKCLIRLLKVEIASVTDQLRGRIADFRSVLEDVSKGESCETFTSDGRSDEIFTANLVNMTIIEPDQAEKICGFYQSISKQRGLIRALSQDKIIKGEDNSEFCRTLSLAIETMADGVSRGDRLAKELV
jgi:hypothetical protein